MFAIFTPCSSVSKYLSAGVSSWLLLQFSYHDAFLFNVIDPKTVQPKNKSNKPTNYYLFKVNNKITKERCEICLKLIIKTSERHQ